jgi:hypothetical protein
MGDLPKRFSSARISTGELVYAIFYGNWHESGFSCEIEHLSIC